MSFNSGVLLSSEREGYDSTTLTFASTRWKMQQRTFDIDDIDTEMLFDPVSWSLAHNRVAAASPRGLLTDLTDRDRQGSRPALSSSGLVCKNFR